MKLFNLFMLLFLGSIQALPAQEDCKRSHCDWDFFELEETVQGEVIYHEYLTQRFSCRGSNYNSLIRIINDSYSINSFCSGLFCRSITILKINEDTIRVLSYNSDYYDKGAQLYIVPGEKITKKKRSELKFISHSLERNAVKKRKGWKKEYKKAQAQLPSRFDQLVLKTTIGSLSDKSDDERSALDCEKELSKPINHNSFQCLWNFFEIEKPLEGKIIKYEAQTQPCHLIGYASLAIVVINNGQDTIRVLDCCNSVTFKEGVEVIIEDGKYTNPTSIPYSKTIEGAQEIYRSNAFDTLVFKTTYGKLKTKED